MPLPCIPQSWSITQYWLLNRSGAFLAFVLLLLKWMARCDSVSCACLCCCVLQCVCTTAWDAGKLSSSPWWQVEWRDTWARTQWKIASLLQSPPEGCIYSTLRFYGSACARLWYICVFDGSCSGSLMCFFLCVLSVRQQHACGQQGEKGWCCAQLELRLNATHAGLVCVCVFVRTEWQLQQQTTHSDSAHPFLLWSRCKWQWGQVSVPFLSLSPMSHTHTHTHHSHTHSLATTPGSRG